MKILNADSRKSNANLRKLGLEILVFIFLFLFIAQAQAAWWQLSSLPLPQQTQEVNKEKTAVMGQDFEINYYVSSLDESSIKDFYRKRLPALGWKEKNYMQELNKSGKNKIGQALSQVFDINLVFQKQDERIMVTFLPIQASRDGKTRFSVSQGKIEPEKEEMAEQEQPAPLLMTKSKKEILPVYPGSSLVSQSEEKRKLQASYTTSADIQEITPFYKNEMAKFGWQLDTEMPAKKVSETSDALPQEGSLDGWVAELDFSKPTGETCKIALSQLVTSSEKYKYLNTASIMVTYESR